MGLMNGVLLARMLGPAEFGVYSIAVAAVTLFATLAALGLPSLVTREVAVHHAQKHGPLLKGLLATSQRWVSFASLFFVLVGCALVLLEMVPPALTMIGWVSVLVLIPLLALNQLRAAILRGLHWVVTADVPDLLLRPFAMLIMLGCIYVFAIQMNADLALLIQVGAVFLALAFGRWSLARRLPQFVRQARAETTYPYWLRSSGVFLVITIVGLLEGQVPLYLLGYLAGPEQAGLYQATNQIVGVVVMGLVAINLPLQPKLAAAWFRRDRRESQKLVTEATRLGTAVALAGALVLVPFAEWILRIYGSEYTGAANALRILVVGQFVNAASGPCALVLAATGHQKFVLHGIGMGLVVSATVVLMLVPQYGAMGAALGVMIGLLVWNALLIYWSWRLVNIRTFIH